MEQSTQSTGHKKETQEAILAQGFLNHATKDIESPTIEEKMQQVGMDELK
jgi:hypothetical protein